MANGETLIDQLIKELEGKSLSEVKEMAREEQERLNQEDERLKQIESGKIPLTTPEALQPISPEEMQKILEGAEQAVLIAQIVGAWRKRAEIVEKAKKLREEKLAEAVTRYLLVPKESPGISQPSRRTSKKPNQFPRHLPPGWVRVDEHCANCGTLVIWTNLQPAPGEAILCPKCLAATKQ